MKCRDLTARARGMHDVISIPPTLGPCGVSCGHAARYPNVGNGQSSFHLVTTRSAGQLTGLVTAQNQGDSQPLDVRFPNRSKKSKEFIGAYDFIVDHAVNGLDVATAFDEWMGTRRQDQSLNLGELGTLERVLERLRNVVTHLAYL